jgi:hypothetical protein
MSEQQLRDKEVFPADDAIIVGLQASNCAGKSFGNIRDYCVKTMPFE